MNKTFLILSLFLSYSSIAQDKSPLNILESYGFEDKVKSDSIPSIYSSSTGETVLLRLGKRQIYYNFFDKDLFEYLGGSIPISRREKHIGDFKYKNEIRIFTESMPKRDIKSISCLVLNLQNETTSRIELSPTEIDKETSLYSNKKGAYCALSPNNDFFTIATYTIHRGEIYFHVSVYNSTNYSLIYEQQAVRGENSFYALTDLQIDNKQNVYILGKSVFDLENPREGSKEDPHYLLEKFTSSENKQLKIDFTDNYVKSLKPYANDNSYNLYGFYSDEDFNAIKGIYKVSIDLNTFQIADTKMQDLPENVYVEMFGEKKAKKKKDKQLHNFNLNHILVDSENSVYLLAEEFQAGGQVSAVGAFGPSYYNTPPVYGDILIIKLGNDGTIKWGHSIFKNASTPSYNAFLKNDELHIILNSGKTLKKIANGRTKVSKGILESSALYDIQYTINGKQIITKLQENNGNTYYMPNYGLFEDNKFFMINDSKRDRRIMMLH